MSFLAAKSQIPNREVVRAILLSAAGRLVHEFLFDYNQPAIFNTE